MGTTEYTVSEPGAMEPGVAQAGAPARTIAVRRAVARLCRSWAWAVLHEVALPNGRRADILALRPDGLFLCIEVKSCARDFLADAKWHEYRPFCDALYFAVDHDFPTRLLPGDAGLILADTEGAEIIREAPLLPLAAARRRALLQRFATLAAERLALLEDPQGAALLRAGLRAE